MYLLYLFHVGLLTISSGDVQLADAIYVDPDCAGAEKYFPDIYDCSKFYQCNSKQEKIEKQCPSGTLWNNFEHVCDYPRNVDCSWTVTPTISTLKPTQQTTILTTILTSQPTPIPTLQSTTISTSIPTSQPTTIPTAQPTTISSSIPTSTPSLTTVITTSKPSTLDPSYNCDEEYAYFPDPYNCTYFYQCIDGVKQHMECVYPLLWNILIQGCSEDSDCCTVLGPLLISGYINGLLELDLKGKIISFADNTAEKKVGKN